MHMDSRNYKVKDIAKMAGVSVGTVDRVLHNRGNVSDKSRRKVEEVLTRIHYRPNLLVSSIGVKRKITIAIILPGHRQGEYWEQIENSIHRALYDFSKIRTEAKIFYYDQFDLYSCKEAYKQALEYECDAMIIGPTFRNETVQLSRALDERGIPYIFVDTLIPACNQLAFFGPDSRTLGFIEARLLSDIIAGDKDIAILHAVRSGNESSLQTIVRKEGFFEYFDTISSRNKFIYANYYNQDIEQSWKEFDRLFASSDNIGGAVLFNSRSYIFASYLEHHGIHDVKVIGCGVTGKNIEYLKKGHLSFLLSERPDLQGYQSVKYILEHILYGQHDRIVKYTPIEILIRENTDFLPQMP